jgi:hypothetical protein
VTGADSCSERFLDHKCLESVNYAGYLIHDQKRNQEKKFLIRPHAPLDELGHYDRRFCWSGGVGRHDLNLGPHPYQQSSGERHADRCFPWWSANVEGQVILCNRAGPDSRINGSSEAPNEGNSSRRRFLPPAYGRTDILSLEGRQAGQQVVVGVPLLVPGPWPVTRPAARPRPWPTGDRDGGP